MSGVSLSVNAQLSPQQIAQAFWDLGSDEMAHRAADGDWEAQNAFQTMLAHSQSYFEEVLDFRVYEAKQGLARFVAGIKAGAA